MAKKASSVQALKAKKTATKETKAVKVPKKSTTKGQVIKKEEKPETVVKGGAVVYLGHIPHGFYEEEMREYFGQFGEITRLRMSRNRRTGASKHYAFIEFRHESVAKIVAETMNNYLMFNQLLQCRVVPNEHVHPDCFKGANRKFKVIPWRTINRKRYNAEKTEEQLEQSRARRDAKKRELAEKLASCGIEYDLSGIVTN